MITKEELEALSTIAHEAHLRFMTEAEKEFPDMELCKKLSQESSSAMTKCLDVGEQFIKQNAERIE